MVQDWKGNVCLISDEFDATYLRSAIDFVTRSWIKCPVETHADWDDMKKRYQVDAPCRFPVDWLTARENSAVASIHLAGSSRPFWHWREWLGFENLCMLFMDQPSSRRR